jgi:serine/threonine protein kinase
MLGEMIGNRYEIIEKIGEGGMGMVYKALDSVLQRQVAVKMLHPTLSDESKFKTRFHIEAVVTARLDHPSIVTLYDFFSEKDIYFIVMQFLEGKTGKDLLNERGYIPHQRLISIFSSVINALAYAHGQGIIHRDIKPNNIMITTSGQIKIMDFGIARVMDSPHMTQTGITLGSILYMSPEQIKNQNVDRRSDIYSLGITLFEMATGKAPFQAPNLSEYEVLESHIRAQLPSPRAINPDIPEYLERVILKATEKDPEDRFQTMEELGSALAALSFDATIIRPPQSIRPPNEMGDKKQLKEFSPEDSQRLVLTVFNRKESRFLMIILIGSLALAGALFVYLFTDGKKDTSIPGASEQIFGEKGEEIVRPPDTDRKSARLPTMQPEMPTQPGQPAAPDVSSFRAYYMTDNGDPVELKEADSLTAEDQYYVAFRPKEETYLYIVQIDSAGTIIPIFPNRECSSKSNPLRPFGEYRFPETEKKVFYLYGGPGKEHLYAVAARTPNEELERIYSELASADEARASQLAREFREVFNQQHMDSIREIWFWHK